MRLRMLVATALAFGAVVAVPASAAASAAPAGAAGAAQAKCNGLPKHSNLPVVDSARVLDAQRSAFLTGDLMRFQMETDVAVVAATVAHLGGDDIASYARRLFDCWGIGSADSDRGVLILVAMRERRVRVEIGKGLAQEIDRTELNDAVAVMTAPMRRGDVVGALRESAVVIATAVGATLPDIEEFVRTNGASGLGDLGIPPIVLPGATSGPLSDAPPGGADGSGDGFGDGSGDGSGGIPTSTSPFAPSPIGDGRWIPKAMFGIVALGVVWTLARAATRGFGGGAPGSAWRGGFPSFGGGDRGWSDPGLLHDGRWSTDGSWLGGGGSSGTSAPLSSSSGGSSSGSSSGSSVSSGSSGGSSSFGGGSSGGGGASGSW